MPEDDNNDYPQPDSKPLMQKLTLYFRLMRLDRPIGILLLLWPTLWAIWIASKGHPPLPVLFIFIAGTILMRSAGCVINDYADRDIDKHVKRTQHRPVTSGQVSPREALWLAITLAIIAFLLILPLNKLTVLLSVPAVFLAGSYPFTKRFLALPQAYLGMAFGFGIPMAFAALQGSIPAVAWWLLLANVFWCIAYDTEYAMVDRDDDIHLGIHSSALFFGKYDVFAVMCCYAAALIILAGLGNTLSLGAAFYTALFVASGIATYHYTLIRQRQRDRCFKAFLHNNWFGAVVFAGLILDYLLHV
jgi:4-hydroxybenzoate polyprenyltransferase